MISEPENSDGLICGIFQYLIKLSSASAVVETAHATAIEHKRFLILILNFANNQPVKFVFKSQCFFHQDAKLSLNGVLFFFFIHYEVCSLPKARPSYEEIS